MSVDFKPIQNEYKELGSFRVWCQKVLPLVYDDSLSYYELLCKVIMYLNETIENVDKMGEDISSLYTAYSELENYVNNYFDNLDVQVEINNKLDSMARSGELTAIVRPYISTVVAEWLEEHLTVSNLIDDTLTVTGAGADAKTTGDNFKNSGRIFNFVNGDFGSLVSLYNDLNRTYVVKWVDSEAHTIYGNCGTMTRGITNIGENDSTTRVKFTELEFVKTSDSSIVGLFYDVEANTFSLKDIKEATLSDYICLIMHQYNVDFLGNDRFFSNFNLGDEYHVRKYLPLLSRKAELINGKIDINSDTKVIGFNGVSILFGEAGQFSSAYSGYLSYSDLDNTENIWYLMYNSTTQVYEVFDRTMLQELYTKDTYKNYYVVLVFYNNVVGYVTPNKGRFYVNGCDVFGNVNSPTDIPVLKMITGGEGQLIIGISSDGKYVLNWTADASSHIQCEAGDSKLRMVYNGTSGVGTDIVFYEVRSDVNNVDDGTDFTVLCYNTFGNNLSFKYLHDMSYGDYAVAMMFGSQFNMLGNESFFANVNTVEEKHIFRIVPFLSKKGEIIRGRVNIDTVNKRVYTDGNLFVACGAFGQYQSGVVFDIDISEKPSGYMWYLMYNKDSKVVSVFTTNDLSSIYGSADYSKWHMLFAFYSNKILFTSTLDGVYYVDGKDYFGYTTAFSKFADLSRKTVSIFDNMVFCGDSLMCGYMYNTNGVAETKIDNSWVAYLQKITGANKYTNCGVAGANTITWSSDSNGLNKAMGVNTQCYVMGLGVNDSALSSDRYVPLGEISDIPIMKNSTFYGMLSRNIYDLLDNKPSAHMFVLTMPKESTTTVDAYNQAIRDVVSHYSFYKVHLIDLAKHLDLFNMPSLVGDVKSGHYTAIGYQQIAEIMCYLLSDYIDNNIADFQDVAFITHD